MQSDETRWRQPSWPWELEFLVLVCVVIALFGPWFAHVMSPELTDLVPVVQAESMLARHTEEAIQTRQDFLWSAFIVILYAGHLVLAIRSAEFITVSATHLLSPTFFGLLGYFRLCEFNTVYAFNDVFFRGKLTEVILLVAGIQFLCWLSARSRMAMYLRRFEGIEWGLRVRPRRDKTYWRLLLLRVQPLFYPPKEFLACPEGILIRGYSYLMAIPANEIEYIFPVKEAQLFSPGLFLATATHDLIGLKLFENDATVFISPRNITRFFTYCEMLVEGKGQPKGNVRVVQASPQPS